MKKGFFLLYFLSSVLFGQYAPQPSDAPAQPVPFYYEYQDQHDLLIFHGTIPSEKEPEVRMLIQKYIEYRPSRHYYNDQLEALGIQVEVIQEDHHHKFNLPDDVHTPDLPRNVNPKIDHHDPLYRP